MLSSAKPTTCVLEAFVARTILLLKFAHRGLGARRAGRVVRNGARRHEKRGKHQLKIHWRETTCNENLSCSEGAQILFCVSITLLNHMKDNAETVFQEMFHTNSAEFPKSLNLKPTTLLFPQRIRTLIVALASQTPETLLPNP